MDKIYKYISDNVLDSIIIEKENKFIWDLMNTYEFNRLTRITQLGLVSILYPTATHSRKSHSIGVYELMRRALKLINHNLKPLSIKAALSAALLHDLGHGPLSHVFEEVHNFPHEKYSIKIIEDENSETNKILKEENPSLLNEVVLLIEKKHPIKWLNSLLSGEFDLDRMDYLMRDSLMTGAKYGMQNYEYGFSKIIIEDDKMLFTESAVPFLESFLYGRYYMYKNVYKHKKCQAFQSLYVFFFERIKYLLKQNYNFNDACIDVEFLKKILSSQQLSIKEFLYLDDNYFWNLVKILNNSNDKYLKKITNLLLRGKIPKTTEITLEEFKKLNLNKNDYQNKKLIDSEINISNENKNEAILVKTKNGVLTINTLSILLNDKITKKIKQNTINYLVEI